MINQQFTKPVLGLINSIKEGIATLIKCFHFSVAMGLLMLLFSSSCKRKMPEPTQTGEKETFAIENFANLQKRLKDRIDANSVEPGRIHRNLSKVNDSFTKIYTSAEKANMSSLLIMALDSISEKNPLDRSIISDIKQALKKQGSKNTSADTNAGNNATLEYINDLEKSNRNYMILAIFAVLLAVLGLLSMVKFREKLIEQKIKNREKDKELEELRQQLLTKKDNQKIIPNVISQNPVVVAPNLNENSINIKTEYKQDYPSETVKPTNLTLFYLSTPQLDGSFNDNSKTAAYVPTSSMYKFSLISSNRAKFEFINDPSSLKDALNYPDTYLLPVCRSLNVRNVNAYKITTVNSGIAELREGKWIVLEKSKAEIRYE